MGKIKPVVLLGAAVVVAIIITLLIYSSIQKRIGASKEPLLETQPIATATVDLQWGTVIVKEMIKMEPFLKNSLPAGAYTDMNSLIGRVVISSIKAREPFLESRLAAQNIKTGGVAAIIGPKKRAVAVKVDKVIGVSGFVRPGHRVDVLVTMTKDEKPFTKIVLQNILVLTAGPEVETAKGKEQQQAAVDVITLEVTPEEAEKLGLAAAQGRLQLALRGLIDTEDVLTKGSTIPALLSSYSGSGPADAKGKTTASKPVQTQRRVFSVELIQGGKVIMQKFEEGK